MCAGVICVCVAVSVPGGRVSVAAYACGSRRRRESESEQLNKVSRLIIRLLTIMYRSASWRICLSLMCCPLEHKRDRHVSVRRRTVGHELAGHGGFSRCARMHLVCVFSAESVWSGARRPDRSRIGQPVWTTALSGGDGSGLDGCKTTQRRSSNTKAHRNKRNRRSGAVPSSSIPRLR